MLNVMDLYISHFVWTRRCYLLKLSHPHHPLLGRCKAGASTCRSPSACLPWTSTSLPMRTCRCASTTPARASE
eukprot:6783627-Alexandrium_andersonii.AAC.1